MRSSQLSPRVVRQRQEAGPVGLLAYGPMSRRLLILLGFALVLSALGAVALADNSGSGLQDKIVHARAREADLAVQIDAVTGQIRSLEAQAVDVSARLST